MKRGDGMHCSNLCDFLQNPNKYSHIYLSDRKISKKTIIALTEALKTNHSIVGIFIKKNQIGDEGVIVNYHDIE